MSDSGSFDPHEAGSTGTLREQAIQRIRRRRIFWTHVVVHVVGTVILIAIWAVSEYHNAGGWPTGFHTGRRFHDWDPWIIYPISAGTAALAIHGWIAFGLKPVTEDEIMRAVEHIRAGH